MAALTGRQISHWDDLAELKRRSDEIVCGDLLTLRLRELPVSG